MMKLYNTLTRRTDVFTPIRPPTVGMYTCGMTVYDFAHIGHGRKYVGDDLLRRVLTRFGFAVTHVQNVTDVGHLSSDSDEGEDKLEKGAVKFGKTVWEVADYFTKHFYDSMGKLNILEPTTICKATDHIPEQIALVATLIAKGFAYDTPEAVYFDTTKFPAYGKLFGQNLDEKKVAVREEVHTGEHKKNPVDFALWFKRVGRFADHAMHWESPWGDGFPGWHIECSAMSMKYLGESFDIHTGGIDHIPVHHPNEIAQSEAATNKPFVKYWVHHAFLMVDGRKMSKSLGNIYTIEDVVKKGFDPLALRYFYMTAHYRKPLNFTWEALRSAANSLAELKRAVSDLKTKTTERNSLSAEKLAKADGFREKFDDAIANDLNMPQALSVAWEVVKSNVPPSDKYDMLLNFDEVLGLGLRDLHIQVSDSVLVSDDEVQLLLSRRKQLRQQKDFQGADDVRREIEAKGYIVEDTSEGSIVKKNVRLTTIDNRKAKPGLIVLFGSGEMSPTGRKIHEKIFRQLHFQPPVAIGILETPTGFEVNAIHGWPERMEQFFRAGLKNYKPDVTRIRAWRRDGPHSTNDPKIVDAIFKEDYLYCGAGSPGYAITHLKETRALENLISAYEAGTVLCLGSATAVAISRFAIPVYEIFKVGADITWLKGLDLLGRFGLNLAIVPHYNNQEGEDFDTSRCWMGKDRFAVLESMVPKDVAILGIDEQTACIVDVIKREMTVAGIGRVTIRKNNQEKIFGVNQIIAFTEF